MPWLYTIKEEEINNIIKWLDENKVQSKEDFYQMDKVQENLPELGVIVFNLLINNRLWYPKEE